MPASPLPRKALRDLFWLVHGKAGWGCLRSQLSAGDWVQLVAWDDELMTKEHKAWERAQLREIDKKAKAFAAEVRAEEMEPRPADDGISEDQVQAARKYPMRDLVGPLTNGKVLCPYHQDRRPSMHVFEDGAKCFSCGAYADPIEWLRKTRGLSFKDAVRCLGYA